MARPTIGNAFRIAQRLTAGVILILCLGVLFSGGHGSQLAGRPGGHHLPEVLPLAATVAEAPVLARAGWTAAASSEETRWENAPASNVLDGNPATFWHSAYSAVPPALPQSITIDMHAAQAVSGLVYKPRQDIGNGAIGQYQILVSADGTTWGAPVATGTWADTYDDKTTSFSLVSTRFVRLTALTEAGNRGLWATAAEINLLGTPTTTPPAATTPPATTQPTVTTTTPPATTTAPAATTTAPVTTTAPPVTTTAPPVTTTTAPVTTTTAPGTTSSVLARTGWTAAASSEETRAENAPASNVLDGNPTTFWHSAYSAVPPSLPQSITIDMHALQTVSGLIYKPRQDYANGSIGQYQISTSTDGTTWGAPIATGTWADTYTDKTATFPNTTTRFVKLTALTEAGNRGLWTTAAEINLLGTTTTTPTTPPATTTTVPVTTTTAPPVTTTAPPVTTTTAPGTTSSVLARTGWTAAASSEETRAENAPASNVLDGNPTTFWHSAYSATAPSLPQSITIDMHALQTVSGLIYKPRQDYANGSIGQYQISTSTDGTTWGAPIATGTWADTYTDKTATFANTTTRFVKLTALTEAGNRGLWTTAAEINLLGTTTTTPTTPPATTTAPAATTTAPVTTTAPPVTTTAPPVTTTAPPATTTTAPGTTSSVLARTGWTAAASSEETRAENAPASNVLDGNPTTFWHSAYSAIAPSLPQSITIDMHALQTVSGLIYKPRQDYANGSIGQYQISTSTDGTTWGAPIATGTWADTYTDKTATFANTTTRFVKLTALTEAGNRGLWTTTAEINLLGTTTTTPTTPPATTTTVPVTTTTPAATTTAPPGTGTPSPTSSVTADRTVDLPRDGWTATASDFESQAENGSPSHVLDGDLNTIWHSNYSANVGFPHWLVIDMHANHDVAGIAYQPRLDPKNGRIGQYEISLSNDGTTWTSPVAAGTWGDVNIEQTVLFPARSARYVRLTALSEAGDRGAVTSVAELKVLTPDAGANPSTIGSWGPTIGFPLVPVAAALLPGNRLLVWSASWVDKFSSGSGKTETAIMDLNTGAVSQRLVSNTQHDMFCPGVAILPDGRILVTGGNDSSRTSIYDPSTDSWSSGPDMTIGRGYQGQTLLQDGSVFTIGGSWSGGKGGKDGEVWTPTGGWRRLPGVTVGNILTNDVGGDFRQDNHAWLFPVSGGRLLHAGPSKQMNWIDVSGAGSITSAGLRGDSDDAMNGNAVMYDKDKILTVGGSPNYEGTEGTNHAYAVNASGPTAQVTRVGNLHFARTLSNSVALPDGSVLTLGGQQKSILFSDEAAVLQPELWDPATGQFSVMAREGQARTYHSVALLLPDGTVFSGGGGLCGTCTTNHFDGQIFTPPYLLNADGSMKARPALTSTPSSAAPGSAITVHTDKPVTKFALVRYGESTHSVDNDQRRISVPIDSSQGTDYTLNIPADRGVVLPGPYMLFALDANGVPSVAKTIMIN